MTISDTRGASLAQSFGFAGLWGSLACFHPAQVRAALPPRVRTRSVSAPRRRRRASRSKQGNPQRGSRLEREGAKRGLLHRLTARRILLLAVMFSSGVLLQLLVRQRRRGLRRGWCVHRKRQARRRGGPQCILCSGCDCGTHRAACCSTTGGPCSPASCTSWSRCRTSFSGHQAAVSRFRRAALGLCCSGCRDGAGMGGWTPVPGPGDDHHRADDCGACAGDGYTLYGSSLQSGCAEHGVAVGAGGQQSASRRGWALASLVPRLTALGRDVCAMRWGAQVGGRGQVPHGL